MYFYANVIVLVKSKLCLYRMDRHCLLKSWEGVMTARCLRWIFVFWPWGRIKNLDNARSRLISVALTPCSVTLSTYWQPVVTLQAGIFYCTLNLMDTEAKISLEEVEGSLCRRWLFVFWPRRRIRSLERAKTQQISVALTLCNVVALTIFVRQCNPTGRYLNYKCSQNKTTHKNPNCVPRCMYLQCSEKSTMYLVHTESFKLLQTYKAWNINVSSELIKRPVWPTLLHCFFIIKKWTFESVCQLNRIIQ